MIEITHEEKTNIEGILKSKSLELGNILSWACISTITGIFFPKVFFVSVVLAYLGIKKTEEITKTGKQMEEIERIDKFLQHGACFANCNKTINC
jgi:hypothetical protein